MADEDYRVGEMFVIDYRNRSDAIIDSFPFQVQRLKEILPEFGMNISRLPEIDNTYLDFSARIKEKATGFPESTSLRDKEERFKLMLEEARKLGADLLWVIPADEEEDIGEPYKIQTLPDNKNF